MEAGGPVDSYWAPVLDDWDVLYKGMIVTRDRSVAVLHALRVFSMVGRVEAELITPIRGSGLAILEAGYNILQRQEVFESAEERFFRKTEYLLEGGNLPSIALSNAVSSEMMFPKKVPDPDEVKRFMVLNGRPPTPRELRNMKWRAT